MSYSSLVKNTSAMLKLASSRSARDADAYVAEQKQELAKTLSKKGDEGDQVAESSEKRVLAALGVGDKKSKSSLMMLNKTTSSPTTMFTFNDKAVSTSGNTEEQENIAALESYLKTLLDAYMRSALSGSAGESTDDSSPSSTTGGTGKAKDGADSKDQAQAKKDEDGDDDDEDEQDAEDRVINKLVKEIGGVMGVKSTGNSAGDGHALAKALNGAAGTGATSGPSNFSFDDDKLNLAGLLNILDGVVDTPGRIVVMTSNHPEKLDPALIRPGRINKRIHLGYVDVYQAQQMVMHYLELTAMTFEQFDLLNAVFTKKAAESRNVTPAMVEQACAEAIDLPELCEILATL